MKIVCVGDIHFKASEYATDVLFCRSLLRQVRSLSPSAIVLMGDILDQHERLHVLPYNLACKLIRNLHQVAPLYVIVGNHDYATNSEFQTENHWLAPWKRWSRTLHIIDSARKCDILGMPFMFSPYVFAGRFTEALDTSGVNWRTDVVAVFGHQEIRGVKMGAFISVDGDEWCDDFPLLISGHIHERQQLKSNVYYTGSSKIVGYGSSDDYNVSVVEFGADGIDIEHVVLGGIPKKISLVCDLSEMATFEIAPSIDSIRLCVVGTNEEFKAFKKGAKYKRFLKAGVKIVLRMRQVDLGDVETIAEYDFTKLLCDTIRGNVEMEALYRNISKEICGV